LSLNGLMIMWIVTTLSEFPILSRSLKFLAHENSICSRGGLARLLFLPQTSQATTYRSYSTTPHRARSITSPQCGPSFTTQISTSLFPQFSCKCQPSLPRRSHDEATDLNPSISGQSSFDSEASTVLPSGRLSTATTIHHNR
jgi:hypothetical protein